MTFTGYGLPTAVFEPTGPKTAPGPAHALVLGPVTPRWDEGEFFAPVTRALTDAGVHVTVVDTLAVFDESVASMEAFVGRWRELLPSLGPFDLLCGNALGGAVAQSLLGDVAPETGVLLVSGPARTDATLEARLTAIAELAAEGRVQESLALLGRRVQPEGMKETIPQAGAYEPGEAGRRLAAGMRLLCGIDVSRRVEAHPGPLLNLVGERSQLVAGRHAAAAPHHHVHVVPGCGMRPHTERGAEVSAAVEAFLHEKGHR